MLQKYKRSIICPGELGRTFGTAGIGSLARKLMVYILKTRQIYETMNITV
jgi:hypothetical protein